MSSGLSGWGIGRPSGIEALKGAGGEEVEGTSLNNKQSGL